MVLKLGPLHRDWWLYLILGIACTLYFFSVAAGVPVAEWMASRGTPEFYLSWALHGINSWCWTLVMFYIGMRFLDFTNKGLKYSREASFPFFFFHQPVIIFIAFFVVQWQIGIPVKMTIVVIGALVVALGIYELFVRRINPIRLLFGMGSKKN